MAGGPFAAAVPCFVCLGEAGELTKAVRVHEGVESDQYCCDRGHTFGVDYHNGPAKKPQWPPERTGQRPATP